MPVSEATETRLYLGDAHREQECPHCGQTLKVRFVHRLVRIHDPLFGDSEFGEWAPEEDCVRGHDLQWDNENDWGVEYCYVVGGGVQ